MVKTCEICGASTEFQWGRFEKKSRCNALACVCRRSSLKLLTQHVSNVMVWCPAIHGSPRPSRKSCGETQLPPKNRGPTMPSFYEFFAGGGMARAGLGSTWTCLFANDFDLKKSATYNLNWGEGPL